MRLNFFSLGIHRRNWQSIPPPSIFVKQTFFCPRIKLFCYLFNNRNTIIDMDAKVPGQKVFKHAFVGRAL